MKPSPSALACFLKDPFFPAETFVEQARREGAAAESAEAIRRLLTASRQPLEQARFWAVLEIFRKAGDLDPRLQARLAREAPEGLRRAAFESVADSVAESLSMPDSPRPAGIQHDQVVWVTIPVRIDLSGGWTDTPPISSEQGGCVVNAAVTLNGQYPIQAMAKLNGVGSIRLTSIDLSERVEIRSAAELLDHRNPAHWAALPKAALVLAGIGPSSPRASLSRWLKVLGGGLDLTIFSALPKGSGMGASSILGAAVLGCLARVRGETVSLSRINRMTSMLEQRMRTGGGWQDQVGGLAPGVKRIVTKPGPEQTASIRRIAMDPAWKERMLLYFTGQKRMARGILENVVWRYLTRDPLTLDTIGKLRVSAHAMTRAMDRGDFEGFVEGIENYWTLKKRIDPGSTNPGIEAILERTRKWTAARVLPGAGGGGFVLFVARDAGNLRGIRRELEARPASPQARFFDFDVDKAGLNVTAL